MERRERESLDRHITGNYGEAQFDFHDADGIDGFAYTECQMSDCHDQAEDGVLCTSHQEKESEE